MYMHNGSVDPTNNIITLIVYYMMNNILLTTTQSALLEELSFNRTCEENKRSYNNSQIES